MRIETPIALLLEQEHVQARIAEAGRAPGGTGAAARSLTQALRAHFERENAIALPPLGLLEQLASRELTEEMAQVLVPPPRQGLPPACHQEAMP